MNVGGTPFRTIWSTTSSGVGIIDQTRLPHHFVTLELRSLDEVADAIRHMQVRGAPLIGVTAAYGLWIAMTADPSDAGLAHASRLLLETRPTAVNLRWAIERVRTRLGELRSAERAIEARALAETMADEDVALNRAMGDHGAVLLREIARKKRARGDDRPLHILTHCNAGWLATVDRGTATAPIYALHEQGVPLHVWVDETRPRNQGASLTAWELREAGVPHTLIVDNAGGHLMQRGEVDVCLVGTDRTTACGDVCNKVGTYLKALAARDCGIPFLVAAPSPSIDRSIDDGLALIPIEERSADEVTRVQGRRVGPGPIASHPPALGQLTSGQLTSGQLASGQLVSGQLVSGQLASGQTGASALVSESGLSSQAASDEIVTVQICPDGTSVRNPGFDVTPARLVTALITEKGSCEASREAIAHVLGPAQAS